MSCPSQARKNNVSGSESCFSKVALDQRPDVWANLPTPIAKLTMINLFYRRCSATRAMSCRMVHNNDPERRLYKDLKGESPDIVQGNNGALVCRGTNPQQT